MSSVSWNAVRQTVKTGGHIPEATYNLVLDTAKAYVSGAGNAGIRYQFKVEDGEWKGSIVKHQPVLNLENPGQTIRFMHDLEIMGVPDNFLTEDRDMDEVAAFINSQPRRCRADVKPDEFNNTKSNKVGFNGLQPAIGAGGGSFTIVPPPVAASAPSFSPPAPPVDQGNLPF